MLENYTASWKFSPPEQQQFTLQNFIKASNKEQS